MTGTVTVNNNTASFSKTLKADSLTEDNESLGIQFRTGGFGGPIVATTAAMVYDTSTADAATPSITVIS